LVILSTTVIEEIYKDSRNFKFSTKLSKDEYAFREKFIDKLYKYSGVNPEAGLEVLETKILKIVTQILNIKPSSSNMDSKAIVDEIYVTYKKRVDQRIHNLSKQEKAEYVNKYTTEIKRDGKNMLINTTEIIELINEKYNEDSRSLSDTALGLNIGSIFRTKSSRDEESTPFFKLFILLGFSVIANGVYKLLLPYLKTINREKQKVAILTIQLIMKYKELEEAKTKKHFFTYITDLLNAGENLSKKVLSFSLRGNKS
jgi:hypothetical protein